ncbi:MAG TPA: bifunctional UDP-N-acetylglucosamine diphosphorylase/glucosamine-1-phosphate N-acetyltransferase GlmU [Thermoanaerobaculia bacterium]|nr:bifunctional UDP-N-acetylglucosamine diphosphorylase/glucosamine-1-phosphate N-acetyltransferase GlmU [Thermoanaerobaculia bacterium]
MNDNLEVIILAAGESKRMKSSLIKVLHRAAGRPLIDYVVEIARAVSSQPPVIVIGRDSEKVQAAIGDRARFVVQTERLGTGHAARQAEPMLGDAQHVLILSGDVPLTRRETLEKLIDEHTRSGNALTLLTMKPPDTKRYGRIVRDASGAVTRIVEFKNASPEELAIEEVNAGVYIFGGAHLFENLAKLTPNAETREYYLTDLVSLLREAGHRVGAVITDSPAEAIGVDSRKELADAEQELQRRVIEKLMAEGVTFRNPATCVIDSTVTIGNDTVVYPFVTLEGKTRIGRECVIEPGSHLINVTVGDNVHVKTGTVAEDAIIEDDAAVGPYAHLRPGSHLGRRVKVGNFVETKKAVFGEGAKASHLSYIGDAEIGADVNIGAGTITCNYDGRNKHKTVLEDGVFIGSDTQLVAPVRVGRGAYVGAGSTITKDVPPDALALSRTPQRVVEGWAAKKKKK